MRCCAIDCAPLSISVPWLVDSGGDVGFEVLAHLHYVHQGRGNEEKEGCVCVTFTHTHTHTQTQVHEHRHTHSHMHTCRQVNTSMHQDSHVPLITSELTISSSCSQPLQCCPSALARLPHCLTTYRYSNHTQQHFIH